MNWVEEPSCRISVDADRIIKQGGITLKLSDVSLAGVVEVGGDFWYFPLLPDRTLLVGEDELSAELDKFVFSNSAELLKRGRYLGVWFNPKDEKYYIDINVRNRTEDRALIRVVAINKLSARKILAIYNPAKDKVVSVGGAQMR